MQKFFRRAIVLVVSLVIPILFACQSSPQVDASPTTSPGLSTAPAKLDPLPYDYAALEPYIDATTMRLHHDKHHATYVNNINDALKAYPDLQKQSVDAMIRNLDSVPEAIRTKIQNNGGGHVNHTMFWQIMAPKAGGAPTGAVAQAINQTFGSFDALKQQFNKAGADRFGSGWAWLVSDRQGKLSITSTANQDNPLMKDPNAYPILGNDVWEHAYYLKYQNRRAEYLNNWWNVVNWQAVNQRYAQAQGK